MTDNADDSPEENVYEAMQLLSIEDALAYLCRSDKASFYAYVVNSIEKIYQKGAGTFYVTPRGNRYALVIDPDFRGKLTFPEMAAILEHEVLHVVLNHVPRGIRNMQLCVDNLDKLMFVLASNIAADAAVNSIVEQNHKICQGPGNMFEKHGAATAQRAGLPTNLSYEEYVLQIMHKLRREVENPEALFTLAMQILHEEATAAASVLGINKDVPTENTNDDSDETVAPETAPALLN